LRHLEALVAQIILPLHRDDGRPLGDDERLLEFLQLQDSFEWNGKRRPPTLLGGDTEFGGQCASDC
jgi:hypothetical protein